MPAALNQFWREYACRAVIGGKGLVKLGHAAADSRAFLNKMHVKTAVRKVKGSLHTCNTSSYYQYGAGNG